MQRVESRRNRSARGFFGFPESRGIDPAKAAPARVSAFRVLPCFDPRPAAARVVAGSRASLSAVVPSRALPAILGQLPRRALRHRGGRVRRQWSVVRVATQIKPSLPVVKPVSESSSRSWSTVSATTSILRVKTRSGAIEPQRNQRRTREIPLTPKGPILPAAANKLMLIRVADHSNRICRFGMLQCTNRIGLRPQAYQVGSHEAGQFRPTKDGEFR
jgi:hypothetical protein